MNKQETIEGLCKLIDHVRDVVFENQIEGDCICGKNPDSNDIVHPEVFAFISNAVQTAIKERETETINPYHYTLAELQERPTIRAQHFDNLKIDDDSVRVWLSRCGIADGADYDNGVTVEVLQDGEWKTVFEYEAK